MGQEIERKYLINDEKWKKTEKPQGEFYRQGYLLSEPNKTIRVRQTEKKGFITIKGITVGVTRPEFEYEIPKDEAGELLDMFAISSLIKKRYKIRFKNKLWEVDVFEGDNQGLIVAEIELENENEQFEFPDWIDKEVTGESKFYNSNLSAHPFKQW